MTESKYFLFWLYLPGFIICTIIIIKNLKYNREIERLNMTEKITNLEELTELLSICKTALEIEGIISFEMNLFISSARHPKIHLMEDYFLDRADSFCIEIHDSNYFKISTHLNGCLVFALINHDKIELPVQEVAQ